MTTGAESIASSRPSSNQAATRAWCVLGVACRRAAQAPFASASVREILGMAAEAASAERAFVVVAPSRVEACFSSRGDGNEKPSTSVLRWALGRPSPGLLLDLPSSRLDVLDASVEALGLRHVATAPVPRRDGPPTALVVDSRHALALTAADLGRLLDAFGALLGLVLAGSARSERGPDLARADVDPPRLVGRSAPFTDLLRLARRVAPWKLPVLITGESGSGKEGIARLVHLGSPRCRGAFVAVNCAAVPESLLESELFGATRGAYTGSDHDRPGLVRLAHGGTLLLDEVGDMPLSMQAKLLRVLQDGRVRPVGGRAEVPVDVRFVAATHRDLSAWVRAGRFRADLFYRLAVVHLRVPPLRERREDIPLLVDELRGRLEVDTGAGRIVLTDEALCHLVAHSWPGNVRELESVLARAVLRASSGVIEPPDLEIDDARPSGSDEPRRAPALERSMVGQALRTTGGNLTSAAKLIGWSRPKLYRRMAALGIPRPPRNGEAG